MLRFLLGLAVIAIAMGVFSIVAVTKQLSVQKNQRKENLRYENWMAEIYAMAIQAQGMDPFAQIVAGRVREFHNSKEGITK